MQHQIEINMKRLPLIILFIMFLQKTGQSQDFTFENLCLGDSTSFVYDDAVAIDSIYWNFGDVATNDNSTLNNPKWVFSSANTFTVVMTYYISGIGNIVSKSISINPLPATDLGAAREACNGTTVTLSSTGTFVSYLWSDASTNASLAVTESGVYRLIVTDINGCSNIDSVRVTFDGPLLDLADVDICVDGNGTLDAGAGFSSYSWSNGANTQTTEISSPGNYTVTVTDENGCQATDNIIVSEVPGPDLYDYTQIPVTPTTTGFATLFASGGNGALVYQLKDITAFQSSSTFAGLVAGTYTAVVMDDLGCTDELEIEILSNKDPVEPSDGFTPNNDAVNDVWTIKKIEIYPEAIIKVYDRWNKLVFESNGNYQPWKGIVSGGFVPSGTYFYFIDLKNGNKPQVGFITIIR